jgi:hypothetical protein
MDLNQILSILQQTYANEWQEVHPVDVKGHDYRIVYKPDVSLSVAWGTTVNSEYSDGWVERFKDRKASSHVAEIMFNGAVVYQEFYVSVDGGRCLLPLPKEHFKQRDVLAEPEVDYLSVTKWAVDFIRLLDEIVQGPHGEYDSHLQTAEFRVL